VASPCGGAVKADIRTGTDVETLSNYKLPYWMRRGKHLRNEALAAEWQVLREFAQDPFPHELTG